MCSLISPGRGRSAACSSVQLKLNSPTTVPFPCFGLCWVPFGLLGFLSSLDLHFFALKVLELTCAVRLCEFLFLFLGKLSTMVGISIKHFFTKNLLCFLRLKKVGKIRLVNSTT